MTKHRFVAAGLAIALGSAASAALPGGTALAQERPWQSQGQQAFDRGLDRGLDRGPGGMRDRQSSHEVRERARASFERGYRQGREDERNWRESRGGMLSGSADRSRAAEGGRQGWRDERVLLVPNVYPDNAPFQQFVVAPDYSRSMRWLLMATQSLREAIQAMAQQPPSQERNRAIAQAQDAILETQEVMLLMPPELRTRG
jgi:hypothetical protein